MSEVKASGRTPKLTPERQKKLCEYIRQGNSLRAAAAMAGISLASFYVWMKRGRRELDRLEADPSASPRRSETPCVRFWSAVDLSMAEAEARHLRVIDEAAQGGKELVETVVVLGQDGKPIKKTARKKIARPQWHAARWWLENVSPEYKDRKLEVIGWEQDELRFAQTVDVSRLSTEELMQLDGLLEKCIVTPPAAAADAQDPSREG